MITTEQNGKVAAKMAERAAGALAEVLDKEDSLPRRMSDLAKAVEEIRSKPVPKLRPTPATVPPFLATGSPPAPPLFAPDRRLHRRAACVGIFGSW